MFSLSFSEMFLRWVACTSLVLLSACGGGGSTSSNAPPATSKETPVVRSLELSIADPTVYAGRSFSLSANLTPSDSTTWSYSWTVNSVGAGSGSTVSTVIANPGTYEVTVVATSATGGRLSKTASVTAQRTVVSDPVISASSQMTVGSAAVFTAIGAADQSGGSVSYLWNFGDGTEGRGDAVIHTYTRNGSFNVTLVAQNDLGVKSNVITRTISVINAPVLSRVTITSSTASAYVNSALSFSASVDGGALTPINYSWNFGDGTSGSGANVTHSYLQQGSCGS
jgi:PKD repeat protein